MVIILLFVWDFMWIKSLVFNIRRRLDYFLCSVSMLIIACGMFVERLCLLKGPKIIQARPLFYYIHGLKISIEKTYYFIHKNENDEEYVIDEYKNQIFILLPFFLAYDVDLIDQQVDLKNRKNNAWNMCFIISSFNDNMS